MKILVVDDIEENSYLLESLLKGSNYEVVTAKDGIEALDKLKEEPINMIISDILMPRMDGFRLCRECKKDNNLKKIPFVFYTASYTEKKDEEFGLSLGAEKFITKPQEPEVFLKILKEIIEEKKKRVLVTPKESIKEEEVYLTLYNSRLIQKLEKKMLEVEKMNKSLREKEEKIYSLNQFQENVIHNANIWISVVDERENIIIWNEAAEKMSGYSAKEVTGHHKIWEWLYPDENYRKDIIAKSDAIFNKGKVAEDYETKICCKDGKVRIISWSSHNITNPQGITIGLVALAKDITEQKQAEENLKDSEEYLKVLFDYAPDAYYISDSKGDFVDGNLTAERLTGYKREELIGKNFLKLKLLSLADIPKAAKMLVKNLSGQPTGPDEFTLNRKDNTKVSVEISTHPVKIKGRTLILGIARDITERKKAEEKIKNINIKLGERVKELNCLWKISNLVASPNITLEEILKRAVILLPPAWQYSQIACARIIIEGKEYKTENFKETTWKLSSNILAYKKLIGTVEVCYLKERTQIDEGSFLHEERNLINVVAEKLGSFIQEKQSEQKIQQGYQKLKKTMDATLETMSKIVEAKDPYTSGHQRQVSQLAISIAREMDLSLDKIEGIRIASLIHDIGKIGVPTEILSKPTKLSDIEFNLIKEHSQIGYNILKAIDFSYPVADIVLQHHEKINGSGYPGGLKGDEILLEAKIICVADVVEAMSSYRPYRPALGIDAALEEITQNKGILYDPEAVDTCLKLFKEKGFIFE